MQSGDVIFPRHRGPPASKSRRADLRYKNRFQGNFYQRERAFELASRAIAGYRPAKLQTFLVRDWTAFGVVL